MKKFIAIILTLVMALGLTASVMAASEPPTVPEFKYTAPTGYSDDMMVAVWERTIEEGIVKYVYMPAGTTAEQVKAQYPNDEKHTLMGEWVKYDITLDGVSEGLKISSAEIYLDFDESKLTYVASSKDYGPSKIAWTFNVVNGVVKAAYAVDKGVAISNPVLTVYFKVVDGATGDAAMNFTTDPVSKLDLVDANETKVDAASYTLVTVNGVVTIGSEPVPPIDKAALQASYDEKKAANDAAVESKDGKDVDNGATYLAKADKDANTAALAAAKTVLDNEEATQEEVDAALAALNKAFKAPKTATVDTKKLEEAVAYAEAFIASEEFKGCSEELQKKWNDALAAAKAVLADQTHTQNEVDAEVTAIYKLKKTGESTIVFAFAGVAVLALVGLAYVSIRKRRFN